MIKTNIDDEIINYCINYGARESDSLKHLRAVSEQIINARFMISPSQGALMSFLAKLINAKTYLEIGVCTGYSTLWMASNMPDDAKITGLEISERYKHIAEDAWNSAGVLHKINLIIGDAKDSLKILIAQNAIYDMILIDANKGDYKTFYEYALRLIKTAGFIVIDNVFLQKKSLTQSSTGLAMHELNKLIHDDKRVDICMLPIGDGMTIVKKRE